MRKQRILLSIVFGSMLAITGCGGDGEGNGGTNGTASSTCDAICGATCVFGGITPGANFGQCVSLCETEAPVYNDNCGPEMETYLDCLVGNECNILTLNCMNQGQAWSDCQDG